MADISYPQLVHNIKEKYLEATGESDNIKFGEIAQDIYNAITSGGGNIGYQVTFKIGDEQYYIASCQQGESITEPPTPTSETGIFASWQLNGTDVSFPYTPSADVELTALFQSVRTEMEMYETNTPLMYFNSESYIWKSQYGWAIGGRSKYGSSLGYICLVGLTDEAVANNNMDGTTSGTVEYNGTTYVVKLLKETLYNNTYTTFNPKLAVFDFGLSSDNLTTMATAVLDHYFNND